MKLDLAEACNAISKGQVGKVRALWAGGKFELDESAFIGRLANAVAHVMGANLFKGLKPDGSGPMPGRKKDGKPRGMGSNIARALHARPTGDGGFLIAAHREIAGHLARIFQEVEFRAPPLSTMTGAIRAAFSKTISEGMAKGSGSAPSFTPSFGSALMGGSRSNWSGGKRVKLGSLFAKDKSLMFDGMGGLKFGRQLRGPRKVSLWGPKKLRAPRKR